MLESYLAAYSKTPGTDLTLVLSPSHTFATSKNVVRRLELDETMNFTHWPPGFMDATTQERLRILDKSLALSERASGGP